MLNQRSDCWSEYNHKKIYQHVEKEIWRFIQKNAQERAPISILLQLMKLSQQDLMRLLQMQFLLSKEVTELIDKTAPEVLNRLSKTSHNETHIDRGAIKGRIDWKKTYTQRAISGGDPTLYAYSKKSPVFDLPQNRVMLFMLQRVSSLSRDMADAEFEDGVFDESVISVRKWIDRINIIAYKSTRMLKNPLLRQISELYEIDDRLIELTKKSRGRGYEQLGETAEIYNQSVNNPIEYLEKITLGKIFEPLNKDTLYEITVLFDVIQMAQDIGFVEKKIGLIGGFEECISHLVLGKTNIKVYYQKLPSAFSGNSKYGVIMKRFGLSNRLKRPDIIVEWIKGDKKGFCIIEVKRSENRDYLIDGAYKLLGYLKDYEAVLHSGMDLKGILVGWAGINDQAYEVKDEVHITSWKNLNNTMRTYFDNIAKL